MFNLGGATAAFTNRSGGVSQGVFASLNLATHVGDTTAAVAVNRQRVRQAFGHEPMWLEQVHSARVHQAKPGFTALTPRADAIIVDGREFARLDLAIPAAAVMVADCLPLLLAGAQGRVVAAVHVGRAGLASGIIQNVLSALRDLDVPATELAAALGPSICGRCYEVPPAMRDHIADYIPGAWSQTRWGSAGIDLAAGAQEILRHAGVDIAFVSKRCTYEDANLFSYRRNTVTGRFAGLIAPVSGTQTAIL